MRLRETSIRGADRLRRQMLVLGVCFSAAVAASVYFDRVAGQLANEGESETSAGRVYEELAPPAGEVVGPGAGSLTVEAPASPGRVAAKPGDAEAGTR